MSVHVGVLGDPAKYELYNSDFYHILDWDHTNSSFHLLGASENDVYRKDYRKMFNRFEDALQGKQFEPIDGLSDPSVTSFHSRIGLFPSSASHLIRGPSFSFAPYPVNSTSRYLKFKSNLLQFFLKPFVPFKIRKLAYIPLGGKAASKTQADTELTIDDIPDIFHSLRSSANFDWYYLEAGSGQDFLDVDLITKAMQQQVDAINPSFDTNELEPGSRLVIPRFIYGGGIKTQDHIRTLLQPQGDEIKLVPEIIIIGNLSEEDISKTYDLVEKVGNLNEITTHKLLLTR